MAKKDYLFSIAQNHYVHENWKIEDISKEYKVSTATLRKWSIEGEWVKLRNEQMRKKRSLLAQNLEIALELGEGIKKTLKAGKEPPATTLNAYSRLSSSLSTIKKFEESEKDTEEEKDPKELSKKTVHAMEQTFK